MLCCEVHEPSAPEPDLHEGAAASQQCAVGRESVSCNQSGAETCSWQTECSSHLANLPGYLLAGTAAAL